MPSKPGRLVMLRLAVALAPLPAIPKHGRQVSLTVRTILPRHPNTDNLDTFWMLVGELGAKVLQYCDICERDEGAIAAF